MAAVDILTTLLFALGLAQFAWFSLMLHRRGMPPVQLLRAAASLLAIWVLLWPLYGKTWTIFAALAVMLLLLLFVARSRSLTARGLRQAWTHPEKGLQPLALLILALALSAGLFVNVPEWGLGIALSLCLGEAAAELAESTGHGLRLRFPANPAQTLLGHLLLIVSTSCLCAWSLHLYLGVPWLMVIGATLLAGLAASAARGMVPYAWNLPAMVLAMGATLALL